MATLALLASACSAPAADSVRQQKAHPSPAADSHEMDRYSHHNNLLSGGIPPYSPDSMPYPSSASSSRPQPLPAPRKSKIPAFAPLTASPSSPAAHALGTGALPPPSALAGFRNPIPWGSSSFRPPSSGFSSGPIPTTNRRIPAFGASASSDAPPPTGPVPFGSLLSPALEHHTRPDLSAATHALIAAEDDSAAETLSALARRPSMSPASPPSQPRSQSTTGFTRRASLASGGEDQAQSMSPPESISSPGGTAGGDGDEDGHGKGKKELKQTKRAAQNRAAQRAFRERKQQQIRDLETRAAEIPMLHSQLQHLTARVAQLESEKQAWERERAALHGELDALRRVVAVERVGDDEREAKRRRATYAEAES